MKFHVNVPKNSSERFCGCPNLRTCSSEQRGGGALDGGSTLRGDSGVRGAERIEEAVQFRVDARAGRSLQLPTPYLRLEFLHIISGDQDPGTSPAVVYTEPAQPQDPDPALQTDRHSHLKMLHAVFAVADGQDEVNDGGELVEVEVVTAGHVRHSLPEFVRLVIVGASALDRVYSRSLREPDRTSISCFSSSNQTFRLLTFPFT